MHDIMKSNCQFGETTWILRMGQIRLTRTGPARRSRRTASVPFHREHTGPEGEPIMTRNLRGSLLIASMLVVAWATTSEACHRRRASRPPRATTGYYLAGYYLRGPTGYYGGGGGYGTAAGATTAAGMPAARPAIPAGTTTAGPATTRAASAGRCPGWASGPAWASAHRVWAGRGRPRRAGVRAGGAARPGRRRLGPGALTVHRFSDHPAGPRPGPTGSLGVVSAAAS